MSSLLTVDEAAKYLKCHPHTIRRLIGKGYLPALDLSGEGDRPTYRLSRTALDRMALRRRPVLVVGNSDEGASDPRPVEWLRGQLSDGAVAVKTVEQEARTHGISSKQLRNARKQLRVITRKSGFDSGWVIELPMDP